MKADDALTVLKRMVDEDGRDHDEFLRLRFSQREAIRAAVGALDENAALREIARAVDAKGVYYRLDMGRRCYFCEAQTDMTTADPPHLPDCPVTKARALLGMDIPAAD